MIDSRKKYINSTKSFDDKRQIQSDNMKNEYDKIIQKYIEKNNDCYASIKNMEKQKKEPFDGLIYIFGILVTFWPITLIVFIVSIVSIGFGLTLLTIILIFVIVIFILSSDSKEVNEQVNKNIHSMEDKQKSLEQEKDDELRKWKERCKREEEQLNYEQKKHDEYVEQLSNKMYHGNGVNKISMVLAKATNIALESEDHRKHIKIVSTVVEYQVYKEKVIYSYKNKKKKLFYTDNTGIDTEIFNFTVESLNPLISDIECEAFALAIADYLTDMFLARFANGAVEIIRENSSVSITFNQVNLKYEKPSNIY